VEGQATPVEQPFETGFDHTAALPEPTAVFRISFSHRQIDLRAAKLFGDFLFSIARAIRHDFIRPSTASAGGGLMGGTASAKGMAIRES
jgi:hypothetical protein